MENEIFFRNRGTTSISEQRKLSCTVIGIVGLGGTGGFALESLARCGVGSFVLFDFDRIELSNFNRQLLATMSSVDEEKTQIAEKRIKSINPNAKIISYPKKFVPADFKKLFGCDIVLDCSDNVETHLAIAKACGKLKIPFVFCSASNASGLCSVFYPSVDFRKIMQLPKNKTRLSQYNKCTSIIAPAVALSGTLAASQSINFTIGKPHVRAPDFIFFDLFKKEILWKKRL
ncbi:MAG: ThiF family adenylyltransferase [Candidatus Micrarchaeota archaeon]